jgi:hypothetical protein
VHSGWLQLFPLQFPDPTFFTGPYLFALGAVGVATVVLLVFSRSFRNYRRRRNIVIYCVIALVAVVLVAQIDNVSRRALIGYWVKGENTVYSDAVSQLTVSSGNEGNRDVHFTLVIRSVNATFLSPQMIDGYTQLDNTTVTVPFLLYAGGSPHNSDSKLVSFKVDAGAASFSFSVSFESKDAAYLGVGSGVTSLWYDWNATENCYKAGPMGGFIV